MRELEIGTQKIGSHKKGKKSISQLNILKISVKKIAYIIRAAPPVLLIDISVFQLFYYSD